MACSSLGKCDNTDRISRRDFVRALALLGAVALPMGLAGGCSPIEGNAADSEDTQPRGSVRLAGGATDMSAASDGEAIMSERPNAWQDTSARCDASVTCDANASTSTDEETSMYTTMHITIGDQTLSATLEDNSSAHALAELLQEGPLTIDMHDYGNMEKVGPIGQDLPRNDAQTTTRPGDVILYLGNQLTIYYDTNSWSFTRVARIDGATKEGLLDILGTDDVTVAFSL